jgi:hypothetical protein
VLPLLPLPLLPRDGLRAVGVRATAQGRGTAVCLRPVQIHDHQPAGVLMLVLVGPWQPGAGAWQARVTWQALFASDAAWRALLPPLLLLLLLLLLCPGSDAASQAVAWAEAAAA